MLTFPLDLRYAKPNLLAMGPEPIHARQKEAGTRGE
jgi:hypothetical protein